MIIVEKVTFGHNIIAPIIKRELSDYLKQNYNIEDQKVIDEIFNKWISNRTPDLEIKNETDEEITKVIDNIDDEFNNYIKEFVKEPENPEEEIDLEDTQKFEKDFINTFYNKKDKNGAIKALNLYIRNGGHIREEFITTRYNDVFKTDPQTSKMMVMSYISNNKNKQVAGSNKGLKDNLMCEVLRGKTPQEVKTFVDSISIESMSDPKNVFMNLLTKNDPTSKAYKLLMETKEIFPILFNITVAHQKDADSFNTYSSNSGGDSSDLTVKKDSNAGKTGNCVLLNPKLYEIKNMSDILALVDYDLSLGEDGGGLVSGTPITKRQTLFNAISEGAWESYARGQKNAEQEKDKVEGKGKYKTSKSDQQISDDFTKDLKGKDPASLESIFNRVLKSSGVNDPAIAKSIVNSISKAQKL